MDFNIDFNLVRSQKLLLIPQLKQAIEILEMNSRELFTYVDSQLETNPVLEEAADGGILAGISDAGNFSENGDEDSETPLNDIPGNRLTLKEHLLIQLDTVCQDKCSYRIGEYLVDNTDDNGYLKVEIREVAGHFGVKESVVLGVLEKLQSLDPPGICARDLRECLLLQLRQLEETDEEAILIVREYLDELAGGNCEKVAKATGIPVERVRSLFGKVKNLEPRPGREFFENAAEKQVVPDVIIQETRDGLQVIYNEGAFPDICISESYALNGASSDMTGSGEHIREKLNSAVWLIKCLEQREDIIYTIAQKICELEKKFFKKGEKEIVFLNPATFAALLCMHESILEKAVNGKYLQCRWGIYELGSFFGKKPTDDS